MAKAKYPGFKPYIKEAAQMLDKEIPGWHNLVNPETLNMSDCSRCVLGQTFGLPMEQKLQEILGDKCPQPLGAPFSRGLRYLNARGWDGTGFGTKGTCEWVEEIADRRAAEGQDA